MTHAQFQSHDLYNKNVCGSSSPQISKETSSLFHSALLQYAPTTSPNHSITPKKMSLVLSLAILTSQNICCSAQQQGHIITLDYTLDPRYIFTYLSAGRLITGYRIHRATHSAWKGHCGAWLNRQNQHSHKYTLTWKRN